MSAGAAEVARVMDVGPAGAASLAREDAEDLLVFVDRLAAAAPDDPAVAAARERVALAVRHGSPPPGLRRLAEALAASAGEPPPPRHPVDDPAAVVTALRATALATLEQTDPAAVATVVTALVADGMRVVVTAETGGELDAVREGVVAAHRVDRLPSLSTTELRELRRLCATATAARRARTVQQLPARDVLPSPHEVRGDCAEASRPAQTEMAELIPELLADVDAERRAAVTSVARGVQASLQALRSGPDHSWAWNLLGCLIHTRHRAAFDRLNQEVAQAVPLAEQLRPAPEITLLGSLSQEAVGALHRYQEFLASGGRPRSFLPPPVQRDAQPVLRVVRLGARTPETAQDLQLVLDHLALADRMRRIAVECAGIDVPAPRGPGELAGMSHLLGRVGAAARSVGALRHDVLFLATDSPVAVPDVESAVEVADAVIEYAEHGSPADAARRLDVLADALAELVPVDDMAPEHAEAVTALREHDADAYEAALDALEDARRQRHDEERRLELLDRLRADAPALADAWAETGGGGLAWFTPSAELLAALPDPDSADVVLVLGAADLGVERLLLTAVAPRMLAVVDPEAPADEAPTLLTVLRRAGALVVGAGGAAGGAQVVSINKAVRSGIEVA